MTKKGQKFWAVKWKFSKIWSAKFFFAPPQFGAKSPPKVILIYNHVSAGLVARSSVLSLLNKTLMPSRKLLARLTPFSVTKQ